MKLDFITNLHRDVLVVYARRSEQKVRVGGRRAPVRAPDRMVYDMDGTGSCVMIAPMGVSCAQLGALEDTTLVASEGDMCCPD